MQIRGCIRQLNKRKRRKRRDHLNAEWIQLFFNALAVVCFMPSLPPVQRCAEQALIGWHEGNIFNVFEGWAAGVSRWLTRCLRFKVESQKQRVEAERGKLGRGFERPIL